MIRYANALILIILSSTIFSACDDAVEIPDTAAPEVTVKNLIENQRVSGTITIEVTAEDQNTELSMRLFLDGNLLKETANGIIGVQVDTKTLTEGTHTIKITATDKAGNSSEKIFNFDVRNILFKVHVSSNYVPEYTQIYYGLSRNDGSLIALHEVQNGRTIVIPTPANFNPDSSFVLTEYFYLYQPHSEVGADVSNLEYLIKSMNLYAGLHAGEFNLPEFESILPEVGTHEVEVTELPGFIYRAELTGSNMGSFSGQFGVETITAEFGMTNTTSDLYFWLTDANTVAAQTYVPTYNYIESIQVGGSTLFSFTGLPQMQKAEVTTPDNAGSYECYVYSDPTGVGSTLFSRYGVFDNGKFPVYYPAGIYPKYVFDLHYQLGANKYENRLRGVIPPSSFQKLNAAVSNVNYLNRKLKVTSTGTYDIVTVSGSSNTYDGYTFTLDTYTVSLPKGAKNQIIIPTVPVELLNLEFTSPADFIFDNTALYDYTELSDVSDYENKIVFSADNVLRQNRDFIATISQITATNSGGRLSTQKKVILPKRLKTIVQNHIRLEEFDLSHLADRD